MSEHPMLMSSTPALPERGKQIPVEDAILVLAVRPMPPEVASLAPTRRHGRPGRESKVIRLPAA
jgi:hypothetical protein